jgi:DNA-directed RNA polymerase subunit beta
MEEKAARDSRAMILAEDDGVVEYVDSDKIIVKYDINPNSIEALTSFNDVRRVHL